MADGDDQEEERKTIDVSEADIPMIDDEIEEEEEEELEEPPKGNEFEVLVDGCAQEYTDLNTMLDKLDVCLDTLEERSDDLYSKFKDLLVSTCEARFELQEYNQKGRPTEPQESE